MQADEQDKLEFTGEDLVFRTDLKGPPKWKTVPYAVGGGALIGFLAWALYDKNVSVAHIGGYCAGFAFLVGIFGLPMFRKKELQEIHVNADGFKIIWLMGSEEHKWKELEAARFETYHDIRLHTSIHTFRFRSNGKNTEIFIDGLGEKGMRVLSITMEKFIIDYEIPPECKELRSFAHFLAWSGALVFIISGIAIVIGYLLYYRTLAVIFGTAFMATGTVIALMTRKERISRYVLAISGIIAVLLVVEIWAFHINVGQVLRDWEKEERRLGRPPWTTTQVDSNEQSHENKEK